MCFRLTNGVSNQALCQTRVRQNSRHFVLLAIANACGGFFRVLRSLNNGL